MGVAVCPASATVTVVAQQQVDQDFSLTAKEINCGFIEGTVTCAFDNAPVSGAIVKVEGDALTSPLFALTDSSGFYGICVPEGTFTVTVFCCQTDCCVDTDCPDCLCNGCP